MGQKVLLVEGVDGVGKSTFVDHLEKKWTEMGKRVLTIHNTASDIRTHDWYKNVMHEHSLQGYDVIVWDRSFIGTFIWPFFFWEQQMTIKDPGWLRKKILDKYDIICVVNQLSANDFKILEDRDPKWYQPTFRSLQPMFISIAELLLEKNNVFRHPGVFADMRYPTTVKLISKLESRLWDD